MYVLLLYVFTLSQEQSGISSQMERLIGAGVDFSQKSF